jgi:hypothetical protein
MNGLQLLEKHPYATEVIRAWFLEQMIESMKDQSVPDEFKDFMRGQGIDNIKLSIMIDSNPRMLFDVFDENDLFIEIFMYPDVTFTCKIGNEATTNSWKTRKEAEMFAIEAAFEILENKLKPVTEDEHVDITTEDDGDDQVHTE